MSTKGSIVSVNVSDRKGQSKIPVAELDIGPQGIQGDAHVGSWSRQVSLLALEDISAFSRILGRDIRPGEFAENLTVSGMDLSRAAVLDRFSVGPVELEISQIGKTCHGQGCAIFQEIGQCVMPKQGVFTRVVRTGTIRPGDGIEWRPRPLRVLIITLSDRAAAGFYQDRSGPRIKAMIQEALAGKRWHLELENCLIPDDADALRSLLKDRIAAGVDVIFTTGGTGIGPRDITPETVSAVCDKTIPGIMEYIRITYGANLPSALLSRSVAGIAGTTQLYALPGSVRAVEQYVTEIMKILEHALCMIHGLDDH